MEFKELTVKRRSVRAYKDELPDHETLTEVLKTAQMAPSWTNAQTSRCYVAESPEMVKILREKGLPEFNQKSACGAALIVTTFVKDVVGFRNGEPMTEFGNGWGAYDLGLHDAYMVLAAKEKGLDTLIMGIRNEPAIREILNIPENETIVSVIAIGKADQEPVFRERKPLEEVVKFF